MWPGPLSGAAGVVVQVDTAGMETGDSRMLPEFWCSAIIDGPTREQCWRSYRASLQYYEAGLDHRARVFAWQHLSTRVIFFVVLGLVAMGVFFAWIQFRQGMALRARETGAGMDATASSEGPDHELEISAKGLKVSSPVLGVVILGLSLAFFYLHLVSVYPISEIL